MKKIINKIKNSFNGQLDIYYKKCREVKHYTYRNLTEQNYILCLSSAILLLLLVIAVVGIIAIVVI